MSYDNLRQQSVMKFGNSSPCRRSWRCSSLWRQVALSSGEDRAVGVKESLTVLGVSINTAASTCPTACPGDASRYASTSSKSRMRTAGKGSLGLTRTSVGEGIAQPGSLAHGERTLKPWPPSRRGGSPAQSLQWPFVFPAGAKMGSSATGWR